MRRVLVLAAALTAAVATGAGSAAGAVRAPAPAVVAVRATHSVLPSSGGAIRVVARVRGATTCRLVLVSHPPLSVAFSRSARSCRGGGFATQVTFGANSTTGRRPVAFALVAASGRAKAERRFLVVLAAGHRSVRSLPLQPQPVTSTPQPSTPSTSPASSPQVWTTSYWAGYAATLASPVTSASVDWTVPAVSCSSQDTASAAWVGIESPPGTASTQLLQTGTAQNCINGVPQYDAWWELTPAPSNAFSMTVSPGDSMSASVIDSGGVWTTTVSDLTTGQTGISTLGGSWGVESAGTGLAVQGTSAGQSFAGGAMVEFFAEQPNNGAQPLAQFGSVTFTNVAADSGFSLATATPTQVDTPGGTVMTVSPPNGDGFTVTDTGA